MRLLIDQVSNIRLPAVAPRGHRCDEEAKAIVALKMGKTIVLKIRCVRTAWIRTLGVAVTATIIATPAAPADAQKVDVTQFPELSAEASLPIIFKGLRRFLKDYGSISDFALCPEPEKVKMKNGKPERWTYRFSLNAKNAYGGYTGIEHYYATLYAKKPVDITKMTMDGQGGFDSLVNRAIEKQMAKCDFLPKARVEQLRDGG
jgi:hypothetical protein